MELDRLERTAAARFDPVFLSDDDLDDLTSFTGMSSEGCRERIHSYTIAELAEAWRRADPRTAQEVLEFYRSADEYIWELMQWHASRERRVYREALLFVAEHFFPAAGWRRVFDFGCGVGTDALFLAAQGYEVTLTDIDSPAFRFARHRFQRRGLAATFRESRSGHPEPDGTYDIVVCFDVFEHLTDPFAAARVLTSHLRPGGLMLQRGTFEKNDQHPCHLTEGVRRFSGMRWGIHLSKLGLKPRAGLVYVKTTGLERLLLRLRFAIWRATGLWFSRVPR
jgi:2-polyprenyl-3-methyl-5-hydroxy-6-metoxy-1,4-benzoquinol methylase